MTEHSDFLAMNGGGKIFLPSKKADDPAASDDYVSYVQHFYDFSNPSGLSEDQVEALQCLRDVSRAIVGRVHKRVWGRTADEIAIAVASWISEDRELFGKLVKTRQRWFERNSNGELATTLARLDCWTELKDMAKVSAPPPLKG